MPINLFGNRSSSYDKGKTIDISLIVLKSHLITHYIESNIEENIDMKNQYDY